MTAAELNMTRLLITMVPVAGEIVHTDPCLVHAR